jgi:hypothetical protein
MSENLELFKFARLYLGQANWEWMQKTSKSELDLFQKTPIDLKKSYIVYGSKDLLSKFKAFYLTRCLKTRPLYMQCFISDYANELMTSTKDDYGLNVDQDLIFLYIHEHSISSLGRSETWLTETILNKVASRNRDGLITIILSEIKVPSLADSSELEVINLSGVLVKETVKTILAKEKFVNGEGGSSKTGTVY